MGLNRQCTGLIYNVKQLAYRELLCWPRAFYTIRVFIFSRKQLSEFAVGFGKVTLATYKAEHRLWNKQPGDD